MKFCPVCKNMFYMRLASSPSSDTLDLYCKHCGYQETADASKKDDVLISRVQSGDGQADYKQYMTKDLKFDPTLPRVRHIKCANSMCPSTDADREIIYLKYDPVRLKFLYFCVTCESFWTTDGSTDKAPVEAVEEEPVQA